MFQEIAPNDSSFRSIEIRISDCATILNTSPVNSLPRTTEERENVQRETRKESFIDIPNSVRSEEQNSLMILQQPQENANESVTLNVVFRSSFEEDVGLSRVESVVSDKVAATRKNLSSLRRSRE